MKLIRLNKLLADNGICSRRKADILIQQGKVSLNGAITREPGIKVDPLNDQIQVQGKRLSQRIPENKTYLIMYKPIQVLSTVSDPQNRPTIMDLLPDQEKKKRLYPVGRLDFFSEGLLLLTDDGELAFRLTHPKYQIPKTYLVQVREKPELSSLTQMQTGMILAEGEHLHPVKAQLLSFSSPFLLQLTLHQGINRQLRRMCRDLSLTILKLQRISIGPISLGNLKPGLCRHLNEREIQSLKKVAKL